MLLMIFRDRGELSFTELAPFAANLEAPATPFSREELWSYVDHSVRSGFVSRRALVADPSRRGENDWSYAITDKGRALLIPPTNEGAS
jgi:hypothetical protein